MPLTCALRISDHQLVRFLHAACSVCVVEPDGAPFGGGGGERDGGRAYGQQQQQQPMPVRQDLGQTHIDAHLIPQGGVPPEGCSGAARCEASHRPVADGAIRTDAIANGTGAHGAAAGQPAAGGCPGAGPGTPEVPHVDQDTAACDGYGQAGAGGGGARGPAGGARSGDGGCDGGAALVGTVASARAGGAAESGDRGCNGRPLLQPLLASAGAEGEALFPQVRGIARYVHVSCCHAALGIERWASGDKYTPGRSGTANQSVGAGYGPCAITLLTRRVSWHLNVRSLDSLPYASQAWPDNVPT